MTMGLTKYLKGAAEVLTVAALAFALNGCGGGKKEATKFTVPKEKLPSGVVSIIRPMPNKETLFVRLLVQESVRRNVAAQQYTRALIHYDVKKGNAADHERLLKKTKKAWQSARDSASVATFYAICLSKLERTKGYDPYQKTAMLTVPEVRLMPTVYAKENRKLNTKVEVFSKYNASEIREDIDKVPEGKKLLAISKMYHTDGATACSIMNEVDPNYQASGRSWEDIGYDAAFKGCHVLKTAGKVAAVGLAVYAVAPAVAIYTGVGTATSIGATFAAPVILTGSLSAVVTGTGSALASTGQMTHVLIYGEEHETLQKVVDTAETLDTIVNVGNLLIKPTAGKIKLEMGLKDTEIAKPFLPKNLSPKQLEETVKRIDNLNDVYDFMSLSTSLSSGIDSIKNNIKDQMPYDTLAISVIKTADGRTETRIGGLSAKNGSEKDKQTAEALGLLDSSAKMDDLKKLSKTAEQATASVAIATSKELEQGAEEVANAGGAQYKGMIDTFVDSTRNSLLESILGPGASIDDLDKWLSKAAGEEMKATQLIVSTDEQGNVKDIKVVAQKKDTTPPFAPAKVAGKYKVPYNNSTLNFTVTAQGDNIIIEYQFARNNVMTKRREKPAAYDPQTGKGMFAVEGSTCPFWFTNSNGKMSMGVGKWKKVKKQ